MLFQYYFNTFAYIIFLIFSVSILFSKCKTLSFQRLAPSRDDDLYFYEVWYMQYLLHIHHHFYILQTEDAIQTYLALRFESTPRKRNRCSQSSTSPLGQGGMIRMRPKFNLLNHLKSQKPSNGCLSTDLFKSCHPEVC